MTITVIVLAYLILEASLISYFKAFEETHHRVAIKQHEHINATQPQNPLISTKATNYTSNHYFDLIYAHEAKTQF